MKCPPRTNIVGPLTYAIIIFFIVYEMGFYPARGKLRPRGLVPGLNNHQGRHLLHPFNHNDYPPFSGGPPHRLTMHLTEV